MSGLLYIVKRGIRVTVNAIYLLNYGYTLGSTQDLVGSNVKFCETHRIFASA